MKGTILPSRKDGKQTFPFGNPSVRAQRDRTMSGDNGSAKNTISGKKLATPIISASRTAKGKPVMDYGKNVKLVS